MGSMDWIEFDDDSKSKMMWPAINRALKHLGNDDEDDPHAIWEYCHEHGNYSADVNLHFAPRSPSTDDEAELSLDKIRISIWRSRMYYLDDGDALPGRRA